MSDFRFFDSRQKYLLFITTTNEKSVVATEISSVIEKLIPKKLPLKVKISARAKTVPGVA